MAEINKEDLARIVGHDEDAEYLKKEVKIIKDKTQYSIRIPIQFAKYAKLDPGTDKFVITLVPEDEKGEFTIQADLKKGENGDQE